MFTHLIYADVTTYKLFAWITGGAHSCVKLTYTDSHCHNISFFTACYVQHLTL